MKRQELHPSTIRINRAQQDKSKKARNQALAWLKENFPQAFDVSTRIRPLKKGIMHDILASADRAMAAGISKSKLREAVVLFSRQMEYLTCLKCREMRIDLLGNPVMQVTEEEAEEAAVKIKKRIEKNLRIGRNVSQEKIINHTTNKNYNSKTYSKASAAILNEHDLLYPDMQPVFKNNHASVPAKSAAIVVKHKAAKQYDPDAVARMREKLGLANSVEKKLSSSD